MSPPRAPRRIPFAPFPPSTTPTPCIGVPTPPALEVATLRLFLAVALPRPPAASTAGRTILPPIEIAKAARHRPLSGVVTGLFLSNENIIGAAIDLLALVLRAASRDRFLEG